MTTGGTIPRFLLWVTLVVATVGGGPRAAAQAPGDAQRGRALFTAKGCAGCHLPQGQQGAGPALEELRKPQGGFELSGRLWNHTPGMFATLQREGKPWPTFTAAEMADLMVYLRAEPARDPAVNLALGQALLVRKGCLKCHQFRGEGGWVGIELTKYHGGYESPVVWATAVWNHAPRMAVEGRWKGLLYPRFSGEEMANLVGFLRSAVK
ncbi:MAG TPA: c-type cytochrome [Methylomirabilota bacterium]|nr:c-type cytochrome [Methylomirabilota bacterium]